MNEPNLVITRLGLIASGGRVQGSSKFARALRVETILSDPHCRPCNKLQQELLRINDVLREYKLLDEDRYFRQKTMSLPAAWSNHLCMLWMVGIKCQFHLNLAPLRGGGQGGLMTPGPMDFRGPMGFRKAVGFSGPSRGPMSSRGSHRNDTEKLACEA